MATGNIAIDRLHLDEVFTGKFVHRPFSQCWKAKCDEVLLVIDDDNAKCSRFTTDRDIADKALSVINKNKREIVLLAIDRQLLTGIEGGIADCALFDQRQFRFVEFKTNAERNAKKNFDKATKQLKNTLRIFSEKLKPKIQFDSAVILSCHVVTSRAFPRNSAMLQNYQLEFALDTEGIFLSFDNKTHWDNI